MVTFQHNRKPNTKWLLGRRNFAVAFAIMVRWQIATDDDKTCNIYKEWRLSSIDRDEGGFLRIGFEAIPQNLIINIFCGMVSVYCWIIKYLQNFANIFICTTKTPDFDPRFSSLSSSWPGSLSGILVELLWCNEMSQGITQQNIIAFPCSAVIKLVTSNNDITQIQRRVWESSGSEK